MFAVIKTGGKQYKVAKGSKIVIEKLDAEKGAAVDFDQVLAVGDKIGTPLVAGAKVRGVVVEHGRDDKVVVFKKKRRKNYRRMNSHRQSHTVVDITNIG
ncbi:MAG: 50S ribosomal protein L21 [Alphaproteobacteria bacterium]|nr:50S ribosomal protein L21 [Alphaproteobacteria bacterium]